MAYLDDPEELVARIRNADQLDVEWEDVRRRHVRCSQPDDTCSRDIGGSIWYPPATGGGHAHFEQYDTPHRRLVIRLPAEPGDARG